MKWKNLGICIIALAFIVLVSHSARAVTINWTTQGGTGDPFNQASITFPGIQSDGLRFLDPGNTFGGFYHTHGTSETFTLEIIADGVPIEVWTRTGDFPGAQDLSVIGLISFTSALVTELELSVTNISNPLFGYHSLASDIIQFNVARPVPEPATIALLGIGLAGLAGAEVRRRRKKKPV